MFLAVMLLAFPLLASAAFFFAAEAKYPVLNDEISYRYDVGNNLGFDRVSGLHDGWISQRENPFHHQEKHVRIWARFEITASDIERNILIRTGPWEHVEYFIVRDGQVADHQQAGTLLPRSELQTRIAMTPAAFHAGFVALCLPAELPTMVYVLLETESRYLAIHSLRFSLWDAAEVRQGERRDRFFQGTYFFLVLLMVLYGFVRYFMNSKVKHHLYFSVMLLASAFVWGVLYGLLSEFLWPGRLAWDVYSLWIALPVGLWAFIQFERFYLNTMHFMPRIDVYLKWASRATLVLLPLMLLPFVVHRPANLYLITLLSALVSISSLVLASAVSLQALLRAYPFARRFLAAVALYGFGVTITLACWFGLLPEVEATLNAGQIGTVLMAFMIVVDWNANQSVKQS